MNFTVAGIVAAGVFVLSFLMGLVGAVGLVDIFVRGLFWALVGFGGSLGVEMALRSLMPDLFTPGSPGPAPAEGAQVDAEDEAPLRGQAVDIVVEDEAPLRAATPAPAAEAGPGPAPAGAAAPEPEEVNPTPAEGDEEMPEIGSFLEAFKPGAPEASADAPAGGNPEISEYAPTQWAASPSQGSPTNDAEIHEDPAVMAKAVQTVMKRDGQGS